VVSNPSTRREALPRHASSHFLPGRLEDSCWSVRMLALGALVKLGEHAVGLYKLHPVDP
jgi:hypothetical protein